MSKNPQQNRPDKKDYSSDKLGREDQEFLEPKSPRQNEQKQGQGQQREDQNRQQQKQNTNQQRDQRR